MSAAATAVLAAEAPREVNVWGVIAKTFLQAFLICLGIVVLYPLLWMALSDPEASGECEVFVMEIDNDPGKELSNNVISRVVRTHS